VRGAVGALIAISGPPIVAPAYLWIEAVLAVGTLACWRASAGRVGPGVIGFGAAVALLSAWSIRTCPPDGCALIAPNPPMFPFERPTFFNGWAWIESHAHGVNIAYAGNNIPYRLLGRHFENEVRYVNINHTPDWRYDDYVRAVRSTTVRYRPARTSNAYYERNAPDHRAWLDNVRRLRIDDLFVSRLWVFTVDYMWHDEDRFPIEETWARSDPGVFTPVYANREVKIYEIDRRP